ncbi:MAG TPA: sialate O-acetylesterase [Acidobacteriota bacterium]|nr:sialate O-acetylesterase [Acidobacteriota bacterium]
MYRFKRIALVLAALLCLQWQAVQGGVDTHALFTDGMVLQRDARVPIWGTADDGERVTVSLQGQEVSTTARDGKWTVHLENLQAGGPFEMTISGKNTLRIQDVMVGEVWIAGGESNMEWPLLMTTNGNVSIASSSNDNIRLFNVDKTPASVPLPSVRGSWKQSAPESVRKFSAVSYYFARDLQQSMNVPVGIIQATWSGTPAEAWTSRTALESHPALKHHADRQARELQHYLNSLDGLIDDLKDYREATAQAIASGDDAPALPSFDTAISPARRPGAPSNLYNGMIAPIAPYAAKGVVWYQGESNVARASEYQTLLTAMIKDWRSAFERDDLNFVIVQLAPYGTRARQLRESHWADLREAQLMTVRNLDHTALVVTTDAGTEYELNPKLKEPVGSRLALAARNVAYGDRRLVSSGPEFTGMEVQGNRAILTFSDTGGGLQADSGALTGFVIAGPDGRFRHAQAEVDGNTIIVHSSEISSPVAVRYGWADFPNGNLENKEGLPASPFRTDVPSRVNQRRVAGSPGSN